MGVVQKILRHSDIAITEGIYAHLDNEDVKKGLARMPLTGVEELALATPGTETLFPRVGQLMTEAMEG